MASDEEAGRLAFHRAMCQKRSCAECAGSVTWHRLGVGIFYPTLDTGGSYRPFAEFYAKNPDARPTGWYDRADWFECLVKELACG